MGQIVAKSAKPKRCNIQAIQSGGSLYSSVLKSGEYMLVSSDNSMDTSGNGLFDSYVIGDGVTTCNNLILHAITPELEDKADKANTYTKTEVNNLIPSVDNDIIIGALPSSGVANTIYRVPGTNSYTDYAWDGTDFVALGTFTGNPIPDATPTEGSTNSVQSGGVYKELYGEDVTTETSEEIALNAGKFYNTSNNPMSQGMGTYAGTYCVMLQVSAGDKYRITGKGNSGAIKLYTTTDSSRNRVRVPQGALDTRTNPLELTIESGEAWLYVNLLDYDSTTDKLEKIVQTTTHTEGLEEKLEDAIDATQQEVGGLSVIKENAFIGGWVIYGSTPYTKDNNTKRVGIQEFPMKQGDKIKLSDYEKCRMYIGWHSDSGYGSGGSWITSDYVVTTDAVYVVTLEGIQATTLTSVDELTKYLLIERADSQIKRNNDKIVTLENSVSEIYEDLGNASNISNSITIPELELGTVATDGTKYPTTVAMRSADYIQVVETANSKFSVAVDIPTLKEIVSVAEKVHFNIHCYNEGKVSLGRCVEGYQFIESGSVLFTSQPNTAYIKFSFAINNDIDLSSYASAINTARNQVFTLKQNVPANVIFGYLQQENDWVYTTIPFANTGTNDVIGNKIDVSDNTYSSSLVGSLSSATGSRQGGAIYGDYLFQFHDTLEKVVVFKLSTATNLQVITNTPITNCHAGSGGFGASFYDNTDPFPLLYISSMDEKKVYVFRITGAEGSFVMTKVQELSLNTTLYFPNIAVDSLNNRIIVFGYVTNSWSNPSNNSTIVCFFEIPSLSSGNVEISNFQNEFRLPFLYAQQGGCARYGKLYLSFGNTQQGLAQGGIVVIDYIRKNADSYLDLRPVTTASFEPEAIGIWDNGIIVTNQNGGIYKLTF